jgi:hypothetical protein
MRRRILALLCFAVLGSAFALGEDVRNDRAIGVKTVVIFDTTVLTAAKIGGT